MEEPGSNIGIAYIISQRYPRLRTSFFFLYWFLVFFCVCFCYESKKGKKYKNKRKLIERFRGGESGGEKHYRSAMEKKKTSQSEQADCGVYTYLRIYMYMCVYISYLSVAGSVSMNKESTAGIAY